MSGEIEKRNLAVKSNRARVISVIEVETTVGNGTPERPYMGIKEYWTLKGEFLAVKEFSISDDAYPADPDLWK